MCPANGHQHQSGGSANHFSKMAFYIVWSGEARKCFAYNATAIQTDLMVDSETGPSHHYHMSLVIFGFFSPTAKYSLGAGTNLNLVSPVIGWP